MYSPPTARVGMLFDGELSHDRRGGVNSL